MSITPNIPRLFTALAEWSACLLCIFHFGPRFKGAALWGTLALALTLQGAFLYYTGTLPLGWWMPCMAVAVGLMYGLIRLCCDMSAFACAYCTARAFLLAEFAASLEWQLYYYAAQRYAARLGPGRFWEWAFLAVVYAALFLLVNWFDRGEPDRQAVEGIRWRELLPAVVIGLVSFAFSNLSFVYTDTPFTSTVIGDVHTIRTLVDLAGLVTFRAYHYLRCRLNTQKELDAIQSILHSQYVQYRQSRESIEAIDRKYHDLKHQIEVLRAEPDAARRAAFLDGMEEEIKLYEAQNKTGNPVLDTVLTGKSLYCARHGIALTCVADGALLGFMDVMDICSVFGNLLDNAIECELGIADKAKRLIHLEVYARGDLLVIVCENYCEKPPVFADGLPLSSKTDEAGYHGYGVKSVRYTAAKYGGTLSINTEDDWFRVTLLIPLRAAR